MPMPVIYPFMRRQELHPGNLSKNTHLQSNNQKVWKHVPTPKKVISN